MGVVLPLLVGGAVSLIVAQAVRPGHPAEAMVESVEGLSAEELRASEFAMVAEGLEIPWEVAFPPEGGILVTERPGRLLLINEARESLEIDGVRHIGEGGLLGLALHPDFEENRWLYLYFTSLTDGDLENRVERYRYQDGSLRERQVIIEGIPGARIHNGGRIAFGPEGYLYITTGDAADPQLAQEPDSFAGKILRLRDDGSIPEDNPFGTAVYSYGHRNPQGITWDDEGRLWSTEHGPVARDEINLIQPGVNYGWPVITGSETTAGMGPPVIHSGIDHTWAPAGVQYWDGSLFFAGLRGSALYEARLEGGAVVALVRHFFNDFGRLRAVRLGPDGYLYITTSNRDGRGRVHTGDDRIIRVNPDVFR